MDRQISMTDNGSMEIMVEKGGHKLERKTRQLLKKYAKE